MTVWWCRGCGMEDTRSHVACPSCGSALQEASIEWLDEGDDGDETIFEIETLPEERAAIVDALMAQNIRHRWEGPEALVVADINGDAVDAILDEVLGESEDDDEDDIDEDDVLLMDADPYGRASENGYDTLSHLFLATGRVLRSRHEDDVEAFTEAAQEVLATATPFGIDEETWADIQSAAKNTSVALQADAKAPVDADLKGLHNQLQVLV